MSTRVTTEHDLPLETEDLTVVIRQPVLITVGEYADEGTPDVLVHVVHAVDTDGNDIRTKIARAIALALDFEDES